MKEIEISTSTRSIKIYEFIRKYLQFFAEDDVKPLTKSSDTCEYRWYWIKLILAILASGMLIALGAIIMWMFIAVYFGTWLDLFGVKKIFGLNTIITDKDGSRCTIMFYILWSVINLLALGIAIGIYRAERDLGTPKIFVSTKEALCSKIKWVGIIITFAFITS